MKITKIEFNSSAEDSVTVYWGDGSQAALSWPAMGMAAAEVREYLQEGGVIWPALKMATPVDPYEALDPDQKDLILGLLALTKATLPDLKAEIIKIKAAKLK